MPAVLALTDFVIGVFPSRCGKDGDLQAVGGEEVIRSLTSDADVRVAYYSAAFLMRFAARVHADAYRAALRELIRRSQEEDDERLLENPLLRFIGLPASAGGAGLVVQQSGGGGGVAPMSFQVAGTPGGGNGGGAQQRAFFAPQLAATALSGGGGGGWRGGPY